MQPRTMLYHTITYITMQCYAITYLNMQFYAMLWIRCNTLQSMQYHIIGCNILDHAIPRNTMTGLLYFASCVFPGRRRSPQKLAPLSSPDTKLAPLLILLRTSLKKKNRDTLLKGMYSGSLDPSASLSKPQCNAELHTSLGLCWTMTELISATHIK